MRIFHQDLSSVPADPVLRDLLDDLVEMSLNALIGLQHCDKVMADPEADQEARAAAIQAAALFNRDLNQARDAFGNLNDEDRDFLDSD